MHLLFDLDGTLTDSFPGIGRCINYALKEVGRSPVPEAQFRSVIGTPLSAIFGTLLRSTDADLIDRAISAYRVRFDRIGIFENSLYPGISEALEVFQRSGHLLRVVTVKPSSAAKRVISHFGIDHFFAGVYGPELADRLCNKSDLLRCALSDAGRAEAVMIGDRVDDIVAARENDVRAVAVGWGYSDIGELEAARPDFIAETVADLVSWVQAAH